MFKLGTTNKIWPQIFATVTCSLIAFVAGMQFGWPSQAIPKLLSDDFPGNVTEDETSYILVIGPLGYIVAAPFFTTIANIIGRKKSILLLSVPQLIGWLMIANTNSVLVICIARFIASFSEGGIFALQPMYIGEITEPRIRGILGSSLSLSILLGQCCISGYGSYTSLTTSAYIACVFPVLFLLTFPWMPESPYFLLMKNRKKEAEESLKKLRNNKNVEKELEEIEFAVKRQMTESSSFKDLFTIESNRKGLTALIWLRSFQQLSGISVMGYYCQLIFKKGGDFLSPEISSNIYFVMQFITTFLACMVVDIFGRRPLFIWSSVATSIILYFLGVYYLLNDLGYNLSQFSWIPLFSMNLYIIFFSVGLGVAPNLMLGELMSASAKTKAMSICTIHFSLCLSLITQIFHVLEVNLGFFAPFFFFGTCTVLGIFYSYFWMPETKGKTLEEIQMYLKQKNTKKVIIQQ